MTSKKPRNGIRVIVNRLKWQTKNSNVWNTKSICVGHQKYLCGAPKVFVLKLYYRSQPNQQGNWAKQGPAAGPSKGQPIQYVVILYHASPHSSALGTGAEYNIADLH